MSRWPRSAAGSRRPCRRRRRVRSAAMDPAGVERDTQALARRIAELGEGERSKVFRMSWWSDRMMDWAMSRPAFKTQLFRFVDVFPALEEREDIARHLAEYFDGVEVPKALDLGVDLADKVPFGAAIEARVARKNIARMAEQIGRAHV